MPMPIAQIPGYYYDTEKKKYFKIEKTGTAPANATWSAENVKRRKIEDKAIANHQRQVARNKDRVKRARALDEVSLPGGFLSRELTGSIRPNYEGRSTVRRWSARGGGEGPGIDVRATAFAEGLVEKGCLPLADARWATAAKRNVQHMYVDGRDEKTGLGVAFATVDGDSLLSTYVPRDSNGRVHRRLLADYHNASTQVAPNQELQVNQISDIKCHESSNQILITCRSPGSDVTMWAFSPTITRADDPRPRTLLSWNGPSAYRRCIHTPGRGGNWHNQSHQANTVAPAPSGSNVLSLIGTNSGLVQWHDGTGATSWLTPDRLPDIDTGPKDWNDPFRDVFAVEFSANSPQVAFFGGRPGSLFIGDLRSPAAKWDSLTIPSSITHIRSLGRRNPHQILVAGLRSTLSLYDLRFAKKLDTAQTTSHDHDRVDNYGRGSGRNGKHNKKNNNIRRGNFDRTFKSTDIPVVKFRNYRNAAHVDIGFDYDPISGVVAAAHDDGTVALYSVQSGHRLLSPSPYIVTAPASSASPSTFSYNSSQTVTASSALPYGARPHPPGKPGIGEIKSDRGPIQSLQWQQFPRDHTSSLFVGVQSNIQVYSFGVHEFEDEA